MSVDSYTNTSQTLTFGGYPFVLEGAFLEVHGFGPQTDYAQPAGVLMRNALDALDGLAGSADDSTRLGPSSGSTARHQDSI